MDTYPEEPRPCTVDLRLFVIAIPATVDVIEEANSVGSMNVLIKVWSPRVVESRLSVDT